MHTAAILPSHGPRRRRVMAPRPAHDYYPRWQPLTRRRILLWTCVELCVVWLSGRMRGNNLSLTLLLLSSRHVPAGECTVLWVNVAYTPYRVVFSRDQNLKDNLIFSRDQDIKDDLIFSWDQDIKDNLIWTVIRPVKTTWSLVEIKTLKTTWSLVGIWTLKTAWFEQK